MQYEPKEEEGFFNVVRVKFIIRIAVAGFLGILVAYLTGTNFLGVVMIIFYAMLMVQSTVGATMATLRPILLWSGLGLVVGIGTILAFNEVIHAHDWVMWIVIAGLVVFGAVTLPIAPQARLGLLTAFFILISEQLDSSPVRQAIQRAFYVIVGTVIAIPVSYLIFPQRAATVLLKGVAVFVDESVNLLHAIGEFALRDPALPAPFEEESYEETLREGVAILTEQAARDSETQEDVKREWGGMSEVQAARITYVERRVAHSLALLLDGAIQARGNELILQLRDPLLRLFAITEELLRIWLSLVQNPKKKKVPSLPDLGPALEALQNRLKEAQPAGKALPLEQLSVAFFFAHSVRSFATDLRDLAEESLSRRS